MLTEAMKKAKEGQTVVVVASQGGHADHLLEQLMKMDNDIDHISINRTRRQVFYQNAGNIQFLPVDYPELVWKPLRIKGYPTHVPVLVDHHTAEANRQFITDAGGNPDEWEHKYDQ